MKHLCALATLAALMGGQAYAGCAYPPPPDKIPDGRTATLQEMTEGQKAVKDYNEAVNHYLSCLELERDEGLAKAADLTDEQKGELKRIAAQKHNAALDQLEAIASRFNEQVRIYKAKEKDRKG